LAFTKTEINFEIIVFEEEITAIQRKQFFDVVFNRQSINFKAVAFGNNLLPKI